MMTRMPPFLVDPRREGGAKGLHDVHHLRLRQPNRNPPFCKVWNTDALSYFLAVALRAATFIAP